MKKVLLSLAGCAMATMLIILPQSTQASSITVTEKAVHKVVQQTDQGQTFEIAIVERIAADIVLPDKAPQSYDTGLKISAAIDNEIGIMAGNNGQTARGQVNFDEDIAGADLNQDEMAVGSIVQKNDNARDYTKVKDVSIQTNVENGEVTSQQIASKNYARTQNQGCNQIAIAAVNLDRSSLSQNYAQKLPKENAQNSGLQNFSLNSCLGQICSQKSMTSAILVTRTNEAITESVTIS